MKKTFKYIFFMLIAYTFSTLTVFAEASDFEYCEDMGPLQVFQLVGYVLYFIKIAVPILLVVFASIDFMNVVISNDQSLFNKKLSALFKKIIAGLLIYLVPTIALFVFSNILEFDAKTNNNVKNCYNCLFDPGNKSTCNPEKYKKSN